MAKAKKSRATLSKSTRFEVFKRDKFTCQYCGRKAPDVLLHADHITPVSTGGSNDLMNLITSCADCNLGKGAVGLSDDSAVQKRRAQAENLQSRREQIEMMAAWQSALVDLDAKAADVAAQHFSKLTGFSLNESGLQQLRSWIHSRGLESVMSEMRRLVGKHARYKDGRATQDSIELTIRVLDNTFKYAGFREKDPVLSDLLYLRGIIRNRYRYCPNDALSTLKNAHDAGLSIDTIKRAILSNGSWSRLFEELDELITSSSEPTG